MLLVVESPHTRPAEITLARGLVTLGRGADCDVVLADDQASRHHAELRRLGDRWLVTDVGSTNGTLLDGQRLPPGQAMPLFPGHPVIIGATRLTLREEAPAPDTVPGAYWPQGATAGAVAPLQEDVAERRASPGLVLLAWAARLLVVAGAVMLVLGSQRDWLRIQVRLPLLGNVIDRTVDGMSAGYGYLLLAAAVLAMLLFLVDVLGPRWATAAGLGEALIGIFTAAAFGVSAYSYYRAGSQTVFGVSLLDVLTQYARNVVTLSLQPGLYLVAAGLGALILGGLLRLVAAGLEPAV